MDIDNLLSEKLKKQLELETYPIDTDSIIKKAKKIKRNRQKIMVSIISCFVIFITISLTIFLNYNNRENITSKVDKEEEKIAEGIIEVKLENKSVSSNRDILYDELNNNYNIVIAKVEDTNGFNYTEYNVKGNGDYFADYCNVRTRANLTILKIIQSKFNIGDRISAYSNGGIIEYEKYIANGRDHSNAITEEVSGKYNELINQGIQKVYVKEYNKDDVILEKGKTYLLSFIELEYGDNYINANNYWVREYDENTNKVLNNKTGEWEELRDIFGGDYDE